MIAAAVLAVVLSGGQTAAGTLVQSGQISGRVVADDGNTPVNGARVMLLPTARPSGRFGPPPQALTDADGRFAFDSIEPGEYRLDAQRAGFAPLISPFDRDGTIHVTASKPLVVELRLKRGAIIAGRVLDDAGAPLPEVQVMAMRRFSAPSGAQNRLVPAPMAGPQSHSNDLGEFRLAGLAAGEYYIAAMRTPGPMFATSGGSGSNGTVMATTYFPGTLDPAAAQPMVVSEGETQSGIEFRMMSVPAFRVSGRVVDEEDRPVANAMLTLIGDPRSNSFGPVGSARSSDDGRFTIAQVPAGTYRLSAAIPTRLSGPTTWSSSGGASGAVVSGSAGVSGGGFVAPIEVAVADRDVTGIRIVVKRQQ